MYKASIEVANINKTLKLKFGIIVQSENDVKQISYVNKLVSKFNYAGNEFLRINPRPYITLDISKGADKSEGWNSNYSVNLNKQKMYEFIKKFNRFTQQYKEIKELYYYDENDKLKLDNEISKKIMFDIIASNKRIRIQPCIVPGENDGETEDIVEYEGCILCINSYDNYSYITYNEMEYLLYELTHLDMIQLSMSMIQIVSMYKNEEKEELQLKPLISQEPEEEVITGKKYVKIEEPDTIPKI